MTIAVLAGWINPIQIFLILLGIVYVITYWSNTLPRVNALATPSRAIGIFVASLLLLAIFKTFLQYLTWSNDEFAKHLLPPHQSWSYFAIYAGGRFWLATLLGISASALFYFTLRTYVRMRGVTISENHLLIGALCALIVSWPRFVFFVPVALTIAVVLTILNMLVFKRNEVPLQFAFVLGTIVSLVYGTGVLSAIGLSVLTV